MSKNVRILTYSAVSAALVFVATFLLKIPVPVIQGYVHLGDSMIYVSSYLLGPIAAIASAVGSALSDLLGGYAIYAPGTLIIKGLMGLTGGLILRKTSLATYVIACVLGGVIMVVGYGLYDICFFGYATATGDALGNIVQLVGGVAIALVLYPVAVRIRKVAHFEELR
jgi:uncharacterized membrane protein